MYIIFMYPLNIIFVISLGILFTSLDFSYFYHQPTFFDYFFCFSIVLYSVVFCFFTVGWNRFSIVPNERLKKLIIPLLTISMVGFFIEMALYGVPLLVSGGRDDYKTLPVLHVLFYSMLLSSALLSSLYGNKKHIFFSFLAILLIAVLFFTRQMLMVTFMMFMITYIYKGKGNKKIYFVSILLFSFIGVAFSLLGDLRQQSSGDYVENYVYIIGGAKDEAKSFGTNFYWLWLYIASPFYNLFYNLHIHDMLSNPCSSFNSQGDCIIPYIDNVILPNTISKYTTNNPIEVSTVVDNLTVGTGYAKAARILGLFGVYIQLILQFIFYIIGFLFMPKVVRPAYIIYFSTLSFFMVFDDLYVKGEFFFVFLILLIIGLYSKRKNNA